MPPTAPAPPPGRHNYYNDEDFVRPDPARGAVHDAYGRRLVRVSDDFLHALHAALDGECGDAAADVLYKLGREWGAADFRSFVDRAPREFGVPSPEQMHFNLLLETWRWPFTAAGWGTWRYDFRRARAGLPVVELTNSVAVAAAGRNGKAGGRGKGRGKGKNGKPVCHLYAGLFAAAFGALAKRDLTAVELQCAAAGADGCTFVVTTAPRAATAIEQRDEGKAAEEILDHLATPPAPATAAKDPGR